MSLHRYSQITVILNKPPTGGDCSVLFNDNYAVISRFNITCSGWIDPENLGKCKYIYKYSTLLNGNNEPLITTLASTKKEKLSAILPVGYREILVSVCDILDACTEVNVESVIVAMPSRADFTNFNTMARVKTYLANGDQTTAGMLITAYNSVIKNANWTQLDSNSLGNMTEAELDSLLLSLSETTANQMSALKNSAPPTSISDVNVYMDIMHSALSGSAQSETAAYTVTLETRKNAMDILRTMTDSIDDIDVASPKQLEPFLASALSVMSSMMMSGNVVVKNGTKAPPGDMLAADNLYYDVNIKDDLDAVVPINQHGIATQAVMEDSHRQFKNNVNEMIDMLQRVTAVILKKQVKGEINSAKTDTGASIVIAKVGEEMLINGMQIESPHELQSKAIFPPKFCPSKQFNKNSKCGEEFGITVVVWPCVTQYYSKSAAFLSGKSRIIQAEVSLDNKLVQVADQMDPIIFSIPRDPETLIEPIFVNVSEELNEHIPLVFHYFNITIPSAAYTLEISVTEPSDRIVILIDHMRYPLPSSHLAKYMLADLPYNDTTYTLFVNTVQNEGRQGKFIVGVGRLKMIANISNFAKEDLDINFNSNYYFRSFLSGCYFYNATTGEWSGDGVRVINASHFLTTCATSHLTGFGTGFLPAPNEINFDLFMANIGFIDNSTLYSVLIVLIFVYIFMMIWAHYTDKKDSERRGVIPFPDNNLSDKYLYEISFYTGPDNEAPCESNISIILSGDYGESGVRNLPEPTINLYRRYDRNTFVMATSAPLGRIHFLRVFHDNAGRPPYDSWQLERVIVRDLQQHQLFLFEANAWLSFNRNDCLVDQTFSCSTNTVEETDFSQNMYINANRNANQDHMWMSIFLKPIGSRFSRKERVTVCAAFLYLSMLVNAMWYQTAEESGVDAMIYIGPIPFTPTLIMTGFFVLLFVYPIVLLLTMLFKRARPKNMKRCRALDAIEKQRFESLQENGEMNEQNCKVEIDETKSGSRPKDVPQIKCLPWWTRLLAWIIALVAISASLFFVLAYGITWGNIKTIKWFSSFFVSFSASLIFTQWIKVVFISVCESLVSRDKLTSDDIDCDEELPHLKSDECWGNMKVMDPYLIRQIDRVAGVNTNDADIKKLAAKLKRGHEMNYVLKGVIMYICFLVVLAIIAGDRMNSNNFYMKKNLEKTFIKQGEKILDVKNKVRSLIIVTWLLNECQVIRTDSAAFKTPKL